MSVKPGLAAWDGPLGASKTLASKSRRLSQAISVRTVSTLRAERLVMSWDISA